MRHYPAISGLLMGLCMTPAFASSPPATGASEIRTQVTGIPIKNTGPQWLVQTPYAGNPSTTATLAGEVGLDGKQWKAWLILSCREDAPPARMTLRVDGNVAGHFPVTEYEGPGAAGEKNRLVSVRAGRHMPAHSFYTSGVFQENNAFEWTMTPPAAELHSWVFHQNQTLRVRIAPPDGNEEATGLIATFILPTVETGAEQVLAPCEKAPLAAVPQSAQSVKKKP